MTVAYLVSEYPSPSHTFIRREISALRAAGLKIVPFSIRPGKANGPLDAAALQETRTILGRRASDYLLAAAAALGSPRRWFSTLRLALRHRPPGARALLYGQFHFIEALVLARLLRRAGAAHLHVHFANSGATVGMLAAHFLRLPWSMTLHGISETDYPAGLMLADKIARARFVACASWFMRAQAMRHAPPADWDKLTVVRCGLDLAILPEAPVREGAQTRFVCVARLSPEKGHRILFAALRRLRDGGLAAQLELVGDGPERSALKALVRSLGLADSVRFLGSLPEGETLQRVAAADALVLPSFMEGLPIVLVEALGIGIPVIASAIAGIPELVTDEVNGLLVRASDAEALGEAMMRLAQSPQLRRKLHGAGREQVSAEFSADIAIAPLLAQFNRSLAADPYGPEAP